MKFIEIEVRTKYVVHGYDLSNREIEEDVSEKEFVKKLVSVDRIQSISEQYILVTSSHDRVMYWEYKGTMQKIKEKLSANGLFIT